ncbi:hypothetical protein OBBRIDRAFT_225187 [Obba rivulosa]|uniref:Uncharacterized protein n=1 Tax=Obba rivulosa TaxID=1052685 RepID=A0A8E2DFX7_9APHY|nr:hypothetical protein OBBRIDRAFT_225187 [Obba rivulosa]
MYGVTSDCCPLHDVSWVDTPCAVMFTHKRANVACNTAGSAPFRHLLSVVIYSPILNMPVYGAFTTNWYCRNVLPKAALFSYDHLTELFGGHGTHNRTHLMFGLRSQTLASLQPRGNLQLATVRAQRDSRVALFPETIYSPVSVLLRFFDVVRLGHSQSGLYSSWSHGFE